MSEFRFTRRDVDDILARAATADDVPAEGLTLDQLQRVADEVGISRDALRQATSDHLRARAEAHPTPTWVDRAFGTRCVTRSTVLPVPPGVASDRAVRHLRRRRLIKEGDRWVQRNGPWPDPVSSVTVAPIITHVAPYPHGPGSRIRLSCDLVEIRTGYLAVAALALVLIPMTMIAVGVSLIGMIVGMAAAAGSGWAARAAYDQRASDVAAELGSFLDTLAAESQTGGPPPNRATIAAHR